MLQDFITPDSLLVHCGSAKPSRQLRRSTGRQLPLLMLVALMQANKEKADLKKRVELLELQGQGRSSRGIQQAAAAGFSTWIVLVVRHPQCHKHCFLSFSVHAYL